MSLPLFLGYTLVRLTVAIYTNKRNSSSCLLQSIDVILNSKPHTLYFIGIALTSNLFTSAVLFGTTQCHILPNTGILAQLTSPAQLISKKIHG